MHRNTTPIRIGMKAEHKGRTYEVVAHTVMGMEEDGETYFWDEFVCNDPGGNLLYVEYDEGEWKLMEPFDPGLSAAQAAAAARKGRVRLDGADCRIDQVAKGTLHAVEGVLPYDDPVGHASDYFDAAGAARIFSVEWQGSEVEGTRGVRVAYTDVLAMFGLHEEIAKVKASGDVAGLRGSIAGLGFLLTLLAFAGWAVSDRFGTLLAQGATPMTQIPHEGVLHGPYVIAPQSGTVRLELHGTMRQASGWGAAVLVPEEGPELLTAQQELWDESGRDGDGPWHESVLKGTTYFRVTKPGRYFVRLYAERDGADPSAYGDLGFRLYRNAYDPSPMGKFAVGSLLVSVVAVVGASSASAKARA